MADRIPALVVSGFLGSGKTTLVRQLLEEAQSRGLKMAVVSNEFGELGIDQALLGQGQEAYVELAGGCVCCKLSDELQDTLQMLWREVKPDRVVVETSGVAMPFETQLTFWREPVSEWVSDDAAVVVVNAEQLAEGRDLQGTFEHQVGAADLLLLNKIDLVDAERVPALEAQLAELSPGTPILKTSHGQISVDLLYPPAPGERRTASRPHVHEHFEAVEVSLPDGLSPDEVEAHLRAEGALRVKGFARTTAGLRLVQGVGRRIELTPPEDEVPEVLHGRVVVIRRGDGPAHVHG